MRKVWTLLFLGLMSSAFSGCLAEPDAAARQEDAAEESEQLQPSPVNIQERIDLTMGLDGKSWSFEVAPGVTQAAIRFSLQGKENLAWVPRPACLEYSASSGATETTGTEGSCPTSPGNVVVQLPLPRVEERVLFDWQESAVLLGEYGFQFSAEPQVADLVVDVKISY